MARRLPSISKECISYPSDEKDLKILTDIGIVYEPDKSFDSKGEKLDPFRKNQMRKVKLPENITLLLCPVEGDFQSGYLVDEKKRARARINTFRVSEESRFYQEDTCTMYIFDEHFPTKINFNNVKKVDGILVPYNTDKIYEFYIKMSNEYHRAHFLGKDQITLVRIYSALNKLRKEQIEKDSENESKYFENKYLITGKDEPESECRQVTDINGEFIEPYSVYDGISIWDI